MSEASGQAIDARIARWLRDVAVARSSKIVDVPGGVAVLNESFPYAHDHNRLILWPGPTDEVDPTAVADAADDVLGGAGLTHRLIDIQDIALADRLEAGLRARGYERSDEVTLRYVLASDLPRANHEVELLGLDERVAAASADWRSEQPDWSFDVVEQLGNRARTLVSAVTPTFLGVRQEGAVVAHCDVYLHDGVAQIEELMTSQSARHQGYARALVVEALRRAVSWDVTEIFLIADADYWVADFYRRLGFVDLFRSASFSR